MTDEKKNDLPAGAVSIADYKKARPRDNSSLINTTGVMALLRQQVQSGPDTPPEQVETMREHAANRERLGGMMEGWTTPETHNNPSTASPGTGIIITPGTVTPAKPGELSDTVRAVELSAKDAFVLEMKSLRIPIGTVYLDFSKGKLGKYSTLSLPPHFGHVVGTSRASYLDLIRSACMTNITKAHTKHIVNGLLRSPNPILYGRPTCVEHILCEDITAETRDGITVPYRMIVAADGYQAVSQLFRVAQDSRDTNEVIGAKVYTEKTSGIVDQKTIVRKKI